MANRQRSSQEPNPRPPLGARLKEPRLILFSLLFLISGAAGLIYEIAWERILEQYFGVTMISITLIVAAYMGGIGLGSLLGGRIARQVRSALLLYGLVEIGIGLFGLTSPGLIAWVGKATAGSPYPVVFCLSFLILLIPTFMMGMTLPLLSQGFITQVNTSGRIIGLLYGINTLGAAFGALLAAYGLIGRFGLAGATLVAVGLNIAIGLTALALVRWRSTTPGPTPEAGPPAPASRVRWGYKRILFASFLVGFVGLGYEMLWIRALGIINKSTVYHFPTVLAIYLLGLAIGGYLWGRRADLTPNPLNLFWKIEVGLALIAGVSFFLFWKFLGSEAGIGWLQSFFLNFQRPDPPMVLVEGQVLFYDRRMVLGLLEYFLPTIALILPACMVMGGGLTVLDRIAIESPEVAGRRVGDIHLANIVGSVFGTLAISFACLPWLGSEITFKVLAGMGLVFPALYLHAQIKQRTPFKVSPAFIILNTCVLIAIVLLPGRGQYYTSLYESALGRQALVHESGDSVLALSTNETGNAYMALWIGGELNSIFPSTGDYENNALACAGASTPRRILVIGFGGGHTTYLFTHLPGLEEIVVVELLSDLAPFLDENIPTARAALDDPRLRYIVDDGRRYLYAHPEERFDAIYIDPLRNYTAGHDNLYSVEANELYRAHLTENGVLCSWQDEYHILPLATALVFPEVDSFDGLTVASNHPIRYDYQYMQATKAAYLDSLGDTVPARVRRYISPTTIFSIFRRDEDIILEQETGTPVLTDLSPWLEYYYFNGPTGPQPRRDSDNVDAFLSRLDGCDQYCLNRLHIALSR